MRWLGGFIGSAGGRADDRPLVAGVWDLDRHDCQVVAGLCSVVGDVAHGVWVGGWVGVPGPADTCKISTVSHLLIFFFLLG